MMIGPYSILATPLMWWGRRPVRYAWWVRLADGSSVAGWSLTKRGARRSIHAAVANPPRIVHEVTA